MVMGDANYIAPSGDTPPSAPNECYACGSKLKEVCDSCGSETANHECHYNMPEIVLICTRSGNLPGDCSTNDFGMPMTGTIEVVADGGGSTPSGIPLTP